MHLQKSNICSHSLDVQEANVSVSQFHRIRNYNPFPSTERSGREINRRSSTRKPGREVQNELTVVKLKQHNLEISNTRYIEKVFANVRQKLNRPEDDQVVLDQKVIVLIWGFFVSATRKAAIHLGETYNDNFGHFQEHQLRGAQDASRRSRRCSTSRRN